LPRRLPRTYYYCLPRHSERSEESHHSLTISFLLISNFAGSNAPNSAIKLYSVACEAFPSHDFFAITQ
ncbi:MAG: hypothetical protein LBN37_05900, partial [Bacteroidales bacterium]|nr:hypothetical protein [Bacteroidales bacterium]